MQVTEDDLDEIVEALTQWLKVWTGVRIQREYWDQKRTYHYNADFVKFNKEAIEAANKHCKRATKLINNLRSLQDKIEDWKDWQKERPKEIRISCSIDYGEEEDTK